MFLGEEAEDGGGPRRELWRLLELAIKEKYFEGDTLQVIPRHDTVALQVSGNGNIRIPVRMYKILLVHFCVWVKC